jgi:hypothetical protein
MSLEGSNNLTAPDSKTTFDPQQLVVDKRIQLDINVLYVDTMLVKTIFIARRCKSPKPNPIPFTVPPFTLWSPAVDHWLIAILQHQPSLAG